MNKLASCVRHLAHCEAPKAHEMPSNRSIQKIKRSSQSLVEAGVSENRRVFTPDAVFLIINNTKHPRTVSLKKENNLAHWGTKAHCEACWPTSPVEFYWDSPHPPRHWTRVTLAKWWSASMRRRTYYYMYVSGRFGRAHPNTSYENGTQLTHAPIHTTARHKKAMQTLNHTQCTAHKCEGTDSMTKRD